MVEVKKAPPQRACEVGERREGLEPVQVVSLEGTEPGPGERAGRVGCSGVNRGDPPLSGDTFSLHSRD